MKLTLKITLFTLSILLGSTSAVAEEPYPKADKGCTGNKCKLIYINNSNYDIKRTDPQENAAGVSPASLAPKAHDLNRLDPSIAIPPNSMPSYCDSWGIQYSMRYRFYDQKGYDKGYCDIRFKLVCGWDKEGETYSWFTAFRTDSPQISCPGSVKITPTPFGHASSTSGEYYTGINFTFGEPIKPESQ